MYIYFDLYGFFNQDIDSVVNMLEKILDIHLVARDSSYKGQYYSSPVEDEETFDLEENYNTIEEDWVEPNFKLYSVILYVSGTRRAYMIEKLIRDEMGENGVLLRREKVCSDEGSSDRVG